MLSGGVVSYVNTNRGGNRDEGMSPIALMPAVAVGVCVGLSLFTFGYARGASYITDDPGACANCHVMREYEQSWRKSSHRAVAVCNDCHTPAEFIPRYAVKAYNGFFHSLAFTLGDFPDQLRIKVRNRRVADRSCLKCHAEIAEAMTLGRDLRDGIACLDCHRAVGHR